MYVSTKLTLGVMGLKITTLPQEPLNHICIVKEYMSDSFTNYNYVGNTKVSVSIIKIMPANAH